jgi:hypothetical protein
MIARRVPGCWKEKPSARSLSRDITTASHSITLAICLAASMLALVKTGERSDKIERRSDPSRPDFDPSPSAEPGRTAAIPFDTIGSLRPPKIRKNPPAPKTHNKPRETLVLKSRDDRTPIELFLTRLGALGPHLSPPIAST